MTQLKRDMLFISSNLPPVIGGSSIVYDNLCRHNADRIVALGAANRHDTGMPMEGVESYDRSCGFPIYRLDYLRPPATNAKTGYFWKIYELLFNDVRVMVRLLWMITKLIHRHDIKAVCLGELVSLGWLVFPIRHVFRRRVLIYTHGEEVSQETRGILGWMRASFLQHADEIVAVSLFCKSIIVSEYRIDPGKVTVITNGVDLDVFRLGNRDRTILPESLRHKKIILSVSRLVDRKGQDKLIQAMPAVVAGIPDAHCIIVGQGPKSRELRDLAQESRLDSCVTFLGSVSREDLVRLYQAADIFALPCRTLPDGDTEGFGLVFLEANACGLPVVAGAAGGTVEAVIDGETGLIVDGSQVEAIAAAILQLLSDGSSAHRMGELGHRRAMTYGWSQVSRSFAQRSSGQAVTAAGNLPAFQPRSDLMASPLTGAARPHPPFLLITVDVEEEFDWGRFSRTDYRVRGIDELKRFHSLCRSFGISPVLLVTYAMLKDDIFCEFFRDVMTEGTAEVGIHLHSWITPPYWEAVNIFNSYQCNLPEHVERRKLQTLYQLFVDRLGVPPVIHRAGRWGASGRTGELLEEMAISVDLSPVSGAPGSMNGSPDFSNLDSRLFWAGRRGTVLTVPTSTIRYLRGPNRLTKLYKDNPVLRKALNMALGEGINVRFSPEGQSLDQMMYTAEFFAKQQHDVAVCALHSTSFYSGGNLYSPDTESVGHLLDRTTKMFDHAIGCLGMRPTTCRELLNYSVKKQPVVSEGIR